MKCERVVTEVCVCYRPALAMIFYSWWRMSALQVYDYQPPSISRAGDMEVAGADQNTCIERTLLLSWDRRLIQIPVTNSLQTFLDFVR